MSLAGLSQEQLTAHDLHRLHEAKRCGRPDDMTCSWLRHIHRLSAGLPKRPLMPSVAVDVLTDGFHHNRDDHSVIHSRAC